MSVNAAAYAIDRQRAARNLYDHAACYLVDAMNTRGASRHWWVEQAAFMQRAAAHESAIARKWTERAL